jgi:hypothetical protein
MAGNSWRDKIEKTLDAIHCSVVKIENEHGAKLEALFESQAKLEQGQTRLEQGQAKLEQGQAGMRVEIRKINKNLGLLRPIANDHESRIQALEKCPK